MPLELHIIRASEFIRISAHGHFDLAASKAALAELVRGCRKQRMDTTGRLAKTLAQQNPINMRHQ